MSILRKSAKGRDCTVRISGVCNYNPETTVLAHKNGAGIAIKSHDMQAAYTCSCCHDVIDGKVQIKTFTWIEVLLMFYEGIFRTQQIMLNEGLIQVKGDKTKKTVEWYKNNS